MYNKLRPSLITILVGILIAFPLAVLYPAEASIDYDIYEEFNDDNDEDFEDENSIQICCTWGYNLDDERLTYYIDDDSSEEQQDAVRDAIEEWDTKIEPLELDKVSSIKKSDISIDFQGESEEVIEGEEIAGQTVTIFDQYGFFGQRTNNYIDEYPGL